MAAMFYLANFGTACYAQTAQSTAVRNFPAADRGKVRPIANRANHDPTDRTINSDGTNHQGYGMIGRCSSLLILVAFRAQIFAAQGHCPEWLPHHMLLQPSVLLLFCALRPRSDRIGIVLELCWNCVEIVLELVVLLLGMNTGASPLSIV